MRSKTILCLIIFLSLIIGGSTLKAGHEWGDDFAWYILQAKSILENNTEEFIETSRFTNTQSTTHSGPLAYPWGYPLVLAPFYAIDGLGPIILKLPSLIFYLGFLFFLYIFGKPRLSQTENLLFVGLFAFNPMLIDFINQILSDIPFLCISTLTLALITQERKRNRFHGVFTGLALFLAAFLRTTGILLFGCYLLYEFITLYKSRTDWQTARRIIEDLLVILLCFCLLWVVNTWIFPSGEDSYISQFAKLDIDVLVGSIIAYFNVFALFFGETAGWRFFYYIIHAIALIGAGTKKTQESFLLLFSAFWMAAHITYPYWQGVRYIFPLLPIFIYFAFQGVQIILNQFHALNKTTKQKIASSFWSILVLLFLTQSSYSAYTNLQNHRKINGPFDDQSAQIFRYLQRNTSEDSVIVFFKPRAMRLFSDRNSFMSTECDRILLGDYLVLSKLVGENSQIPPERIASCNLPLHHVFENRKFVIYEINR